MDAISFPALASGALAFTIALAWNDAISKTIKSFFPGANEKATARLTLFYALIITLLVIFIVAIINHAYRLACRHGGRAAETLKGGTATKAIGKFAKPGETLLDCKACARQCGLTAPVVRLWRPGSA